MDQLSYPEYLENLKKFTTKKKRFIYFFLLSGFVKVLLKSFLFAYFVTIPVGFLCLYFETPTNNNNNNTVCHYNQMDACDGSRHPADAVSVKLVPVSPLCTSRLTEAPHARCFPSNRPRKHTHTQTNHKLRPTEPPPLSTLYFKLLGSHFLLTFFPLKAKHTQTKQSLKAISSIGGGNNHLDF